MSGCGVWLLSGACSLLLFYTGYVLSVTITSSPQLGVDTVCDNQDVTLMCHTDQTTCNMITWYWYNQSQHGDNITVVATMTKVAYTCVVSKNGEALGNLTVTVVANGTPPHVDRYNFNPYILENKGNNLTLITTISSDLLLSSIKWVGFHRPLPSTAVVDNYTTDGVLYSRLSLYDLSFEDDSGNYTNIVSNQCGTSFVFGYIKVQDPIVCNNSGTLITPQKNVMTVEKEPVKLYCIFQGNLQTLGPSIASYWGVKPYGPTSNETFIMDNSTYPYFIGVYQNDECNFINQLTIQSAPLYNVSLTCGVAFNDITNSHTSYFTVFERPSVFSDSNTDVMASFNETVTFKCRIHAPTVNGVTIVVWLKSNLPIDDMEHYKITRITLPGVDDLIISQLTIKAVTYEDIDIYACYCYYNSTMVTSSESVVSNYVYFVLSTEGPGRKLRASVISASVGASFLLSCCVTAFCLRIYCARCHHSIKKGNDHSGSGDDSGAALLLQDNGHSGRSSDDSEAAENDPFQCTDEYGTFRDQNTTTPVDQRQSISHQPPARSGQMGGERFRMEGGQPPVASSSVDMTDNDN